MSVRSSGPGPEQLLRVVAEPATVATSARLEAVGRFLARHRETHDALTALAQVSVHVVPGARWASVSRCREGRVWTVAATDPVARAVDGLQYEMGAGPSVDTAHGQAGCMSSDLAADPRWGGFGQRAARDHGAHGVVSTRLAVDAELEFEVVLTVYSDRGGAFDAVSRDVVELLAVDAGVGLAVVVNREQARHLARALVTSREIGVAMGVLMATGRLTREQAFDRLRAASQNGNRKLHDIATEVADTGVLVMPAARAPRRPHGSL